jgi:hypothetical protein
VPRLDLKRLPGRQEDHRFLAHIGGNGIAAHMAAAMQHK